MPALKKGPLFKRLFAAILTWNIEADPEYRWYRCALCGRPIVKAWHVWLDTAGFALQYDFRYIEVHVCKKCGEMNGLGSKGRRLPVPRPRSRSERPAVGRHVPGRAPASLLPQSASRRRRT